MVYCWLRERATVGADLCVCPLSYVGGGGVREGWKRTQLHGKARSRVAAGADSPTAAALKAAAGTPKKKKTKKAQEHQRGIRELCIALAISTLALVMDYC
jgi:hypothetical protein